VVGMEQGTLDLSNQLPPNRLSPHSNDTRVKLLLHVQLLPWVKKYFEVHGRLLLTMLNLMKTFAWNNKKVPI